MDINEELKALRLQLASAKEENERLLKELARNEAEISKLMENEGTKKIDKRPTNVL